MCPRGIKSVLTLHVLRFDHFGTKVRMLSIHECQEVKSWGDGIHYDSP